MGELIDPEWFNKHTSDNSLSYRKWHSHVVEVHYRLPDAPPGAKAPPWTPDDAPADWNGSGVQLTAKSWNHIQYGGPDGPTGGHLADYGWYARLHGKQNTEFPKSWTARDIQRAAEFVLATIDTNSESGRHVRSCRDLLIKIVISESKGQLYLRSIYPIYDLGLIHDLGL